MTFLYSRLSPEARRKHIARSRAYALAHPDKRREYDARYRLKKFGSPRPRPPIPADVASLAWTAGIIDGEGCILISTRKGGRFYTLELGVGNSDIAMILLLQQLWAGSLYTTTHGRFRPVHRWGVAALRAEEVLRAILPYLVTKRAQAEVALEFRSRDMSPAIGIEYRDKLRVLRLPA